MANDPSAMSPGPVPMGAISSAEPKVAKTTGADVAVVVLTAALWPLGAVAMFFTKSWTLGTKVAAVGVLLVVGLIFSLAPRLGGGAAAVAVTAFLLSRHPAPARTLRIAGWATATVVAILCLVGLLMPPFIRIGWHGAGGP